MIASSQCYYYDPLNVTTMKCADRFTAQSLAAVYGGNCEGFLEGGIPPSKKCLE